MNNFRPKSFYLFLGGQRPLVPQKDKINAKFKSTTFHKPEIDNVQVSSVNFGRNGFI
jgi:hypothetical protein